MQTAPRREPGGWPGGLVLAAFCFCVANIVALASTFGPWLLSADGMHVSTDFLGFWPAGRMVLDGQAVAVYDVVAHKAASVAALGRDFEGNYPIYYPPHFFLLLAVVALMPYGVSYLVWVALTLVSYVFVISRIIGHPTGILLACAFPALLANAIAGQNGCLTAALFGGALLAMERRPILAGFLFALLSYKPQFGILVPLALMCGGQWRVFASAVLFTLLLVLVSGAILGTGVWTEFFEAIQRSNRDTLVAGYTGLSKIQSLYALVRVLGGSLQLAWIVQGTAMAIAAVCVCLAWSGRQPFAIKAAALSVGAAICTPHIYVYDAVLLAVPVAYLLQDGRARGFLPGEMPALAVACLLIAVYPFVQLPIAVGSVFIVAGLVARRYFAAELQSPQRAALRADLLARTSG